MNLQEKVTQSEEHFNKLKELHAERQETISKAQSEIAEIEKEMLLTKGKYDAYNEMLQEDAEQDTVTVDNAAK